jgi:outer membrane lipoprotein-sorting protein
MGENMSAHEETSERLADFVLGELSPQQSAEVQAHLAACKQCSTELRRLKALLERTERIQNLSADEQMCESAKQRIFAAIQTDARQKETARPNIALAFIGRAIMRSRIAKLAAAAVIIVAALAVINQLWGPIDRAGAVYAAVAEQLHNARTMTYSLITQTNIEDVPTVRVDMAFKEPGYMRITTVDGYLTVIDWAQNKGISVWPPRKQFIDFEATNYQHDPAQDPFVVIENLRTLPLRADAELGEKEIDGRLLQGFRVAKEGLINTVWVDRRIGELARVEMEFPDAPGMSVIMTDFQFNVELDDSLFSLTPPEGFERVEIQADVSEVTEQDLIEYLRAWSSWTKDRTFPPTLAGMQLPKIAMEMEKQGKFGEGQTSKEQRERDKMIMYRGLMFVYQLPAESNWRYAGENVRYGDADTPIFWYRPEGSVNCRVIYGDLTVEEVLPEDLLK